MAQKYKAVLTTVGAAKIAAATAGGAKINLTQMAVGDGGGSLPTPVPTQTKLIAEKHRAALNKVIVDPKKKNYLVAELVIPPEIGGFWMRELGLYDDTGALIAVSNMAESYKPLLSEGSGRAQTLRMVVIISDMDTVNLLIDSSTVLATQEYVDEKLLEHEQSRRHPDATLKEKGFTQLSSATNSTSEVLAATPKAVKAAYDLANGKYTAQDASTAQKGIVQLNSATNSDIETQAATPKAVKAAYDLASAKFTAVDATTARKGIVQLSSATDNASEALAATPKAVKIAMDNANARLAKDRNGADIPNADLFINNLGLRETVNKAASALQTGSHGIGASGVGMTDNDILSPTSIGNTFFNQGGGASNRHFGSYGTGIHLSYGSNGDNSQRLTANLFVDAVGNLSVEWLAVIKSTGAIASQYIQKLYGPLNKPSAADVRAIPFFGQILEGTNLNTLTSYGVWFNSRNTNATLALNYPSINAGSLQVLQDAGITQIYTEYQSGSQFRRGFYSGAWSPWRIVYDSGYKPTPDDVNAIAQDSCRVAGFASGNRDVPYMRHTASNDVVQLMTSNIAYSKFVQGVQLGAEARMWSNAFTSEGVARVAKIPAGCTMTLVGDANASGNSYLNDIDFVGYKPIQRNIGGTWVTISG